MSAFFFFYFEYIDNILKFSDLYLIFGFKIANFSLDDQLFISQKLGKNIDHGFRQVDRRDFLVA